MTYKEEAPRRIAVLQKGLTKCKHRDYSNTLGKSGNISVKAQGKVIGYLAGHTFTKPVTGSKHMLRCPPAWAIDAEAFDREIKPNATEFLVVDKEAGVEYCCYVETFDKLKKEFNRGFGRQYFLTLSHWETRVNGHHQASLWGGANNACC